ncbi:hypothetical protein HNY73_020274 [Argiope bruennichi]|uniref:Uncharacterized protein n=1 Tax=Argiope bruennichi TaxID=94029 RepID=A0A8T0EA13_ARGBR|nr:hypothetical protein HNY73_020274 [Argiope bruennichi]
MFMTASALSMSSKKNLDVPNYLQVILASYKTPKETLQKESETQKTESLDAVKNIPSQLDSLLQLRRDLYHAYNLTYQIKDPVGHVLYRNEYGDGSGVLKGSMDFTKDTGTKTVINYTLQVEETPAAISEPVPEEMYEPKMSSSGDGNLMTEEDTSEEEKPHIITLSTPPQKVEYSVMDSNGNLNQKESYLSAHSDMKGVSDFDDLQALSSHLVEDKEQAPDYSAFNVGMRAPGMMFHIKPKPRGYEQVWKKGQGLVVNREYELPYNYRNAIRYHTYMEDDEDEKPLHIYSTKPTIKVLQVSRDFNGNYEISTMTGDNIKQRSLGDNEGERSLYMSHSKPAVHAMHLTSGDSKLFEADAHEQYSQHPLDYDGIENQDNSSSSSGNLQPSA